MVFLQIVKMTLNLLLKRGGENCKKLYILNILKLKRKSTKTFTTTSLTSRRKK